MPRTFLLAAWQWLVMLNYEVDPALLEPYIPRGTSLDFWNSRTYISIVGFMFHDTRVLGMPIPMHRTFPEVNLRFYVHRQTAEGMRRGVVFIREIVPRRAIAVVANSLYHETYICRKMRSSITPPTQNEHGSIEYAWRTHKCWNHVGATFNGNAELPAPDSQEAFIAEHYWGYTRRRDHATLEYAVEHPPWRIWPATTWSFECDVLQTYGKRFENTFASPPSTAFVAEGSDIIVRQGRRCS
ncbi:MAG: YqjF family protein [Phycisphaerales bacterium]